MTFEEAHGGVLDLLPPAPARGLDVEAGTGRDAAALARRGYQVVAVEPTHHRRVGRPDHDGRSAECGKSVPPNAASGHHMSMVMGRILGLFRTETASFGEASADLWGGSVDTPKPELAAVLEQYKIYVETADRVSARRGLANAFFLSLNSAVLTAAAAWQRDSIPHSLLLMFLAFGMVQSAAWYWIIRSYRQLNSAKYVVIGALEERLPASPYWRAEWKALGEGRNRARYWPISHLEQSLPIAFALLYVGSFVTAEMR